MSFVPVENLLKKNRDGTPWYTRTFRITRWRILSQFFFFSLFVFLMWVTWFSRLGGYPVSVFLEIDPLVGIATSISGRAWITGIHQYMLDPTDPFPTGYTLSDTWYRALT